jgi:16S rRNA (guanine966-N2)-methyltransferase
VRVIAGSLGGRRLHAPPGRRTRPTSDRVREALFSMLADVDGASVLDVFAGSGALGIEALSRGAERAVFVERDRSAVEVLDRNLRELGLEGERTEVRRAGAIEALRTARAAREKYDLVLIDPPYSQAPSWSAQLEPLLAPLLSPGARVVAESDRRAPLRLGVRVEQELRLTRERRYGDTIITIHRRP